MEIELQCQSIIDTLLSAEDFSTNRRFATMFLNLPCEKKYSYYYEFIKNPISLNCISEKISNHVYKDIKDMEKDVHCMIKNACAFNKRGSHIYHDALKLKIIFDSIAKKITEEISEAAQNICTGNIYFIFCANSYV